MTLPWHLYFMAFIYFFAGLNHFRNPKIYLKIMPPYVPYPKQMNYWSGLAEIVLAIGLCFFATSVIAAWGIIALLVAIYPVHLYMLNTKVNFGLPRWVLILRIPLQLLLIFWAYQYT